MQYNTNTGLRAILPGNNSKITIATAKLQGKEIAIKLDMAAKEKSEQLELSKTEVRYQEREQTKPEQPPTNALAWIVGAAIVFLAAIFLYIPIRNKLESWKRHSESKKFWENERKEGGGSTHRQGSE